MDHTYHLSSRRKTQLSREQYIDEMLIAHCDPCQKTLNQYLLWRRNVAREQQHELCNISFFKLLNKSSQQLNDIDSHLAQMEKIIGNNLNYKEDMCEELKELMNNNKKS